MEILWSDRKRHFGLPLSLSKYSLSEDRIFLETGLLNLKEDEILLYRIRDVSLIRKLGQRIFGVGTVCLLSTDATNPHLELKNIKRPKEVKEMISTLVENAKDKRRLRSTELLEDDGIIDDDCSAD